MIPHTSTMNEKGSVIVPAAIRARHGWGAGTVLVFQEGESGVRVASVDEALAAFRRSVAGKGGVLEELLAERRAEAAREGVG